MLLLGGPFHPGPPRLSLPCLPSRDAAVNVPWTPTDSCDGTCENSQVSASKRWLTLAALSCNCQLKLANFHRWLQIEVYTVLVLRCSRLHGSRTE